MTVTVYVDVLFAVNFGADLVLLLLAGKLLGLSPRPLRLILAAALGAAYASAVFFLPLTFLQSFGMKLLSSAVMVLTAFGAGSFRAFCRRLSVFYLVALTLSGLCFALFSATGAGARLGAVYANGALYLDLPLWRLLPAVLAAALLLRSAFRTAKKAGQSAAHLRRVRLEYRGRSVTLPALGDTGNLLADPCGDGVLLAHWNAVRPLFDTACSLSEAPGLFPNAFSWIACEGVGGRELLPAFRAAVFPASGRRKKRSDAAPALRLVALRAEPFGPEAQFSLILPGDLLS